MQSFEALSEQIRIEEQEILRESDNEVDDAQTSDALESIRSKIPAKKPWGRPVKEGKAKPKTKRLWSDDEALLLIKYWKTEEPLYNTKSEKYHLKDEKAKSLKKIALKLHGDGISDVNEEMITEKIGSLRSYYGAEKRKDKASKSSGAGTSEVYTGFWKFINELNFLN